MFNMQTASAVRLEPHFRIERAGCDVTVSNVRVEDGSTKHRLCLTRDGSTVACTNVARNSKFSVAELEIRARKGRLGPTTDMYRAMVDLAKIAEDFFGVGVVG